ncbi:FIG00870734: hypothetical protein [uncultured Coleofasciculus sp.]|uniref:DUF3086 domain-containing protein n=1 Tax=uncultured Coleofasciculus sp. TaxID=1267456 RepID=A0A6J4I5T2_9CYAN|nr:FIG00870734: hypothetical protein [uncultured Coleofasciculus sp.]
MNSDEPKIPEQEQAQQPVAEVFDEQEQAQQPVAEVFDEQEQAQQPVAEASSDLEALSPIAALVQTDGDDELTPSDDVDSTTQLSKPIQASQLEKLGEQRAEIALEKPDDNDRLVADLTQTVEQLKRQEQELRQKIAALQERESKILSDHLAQSQAVVERMLQEGLTELEQRKQTLQVSVEQLERRRERIRAEMRTSFAGVSQELAIRVQGFKDYLVGSLQDLASAAEQLDLVPLNEPPPVVEESRSPSSEKTLTPKFAEQGFQEQARQIRKILDQYRTLPDYYGPPWQLRRTFEPVHAERVSNWLFTQGGRGAIKTMGSRLQNVLVASATISVLRTLYGDRLRTLIIANSPERLGEWRRGLQDCLGISRSDFGPERGIVLFEEASALVQKADRLLTQKQLPLVLIDETEDQINLSLLQFPLWLAFAPDPQQVSSYQY